MTNLPDTVTPFTVCGLKFIFVEIIIYTLYVTPSRVCGLKLHHHSLRFMVTIVTLHGCVD